MGSDTTIELFYGFKIPLLIVFDSELLDSEILNVDDYQLISFEEYKDEIVNKYITNPILKNILKNWNCYILTSSQDEPNIDESFLIIYNNRVLLSDSSSDYETGTVNLFENKEIPKSIYDIKLSDDYEWIYKIHWVVECSY